jgi:hypothetical protein
MLGCEGLPIFIEGLNFMFSKWKNLINSLDYKKKNGM